MARIGLVLVAAMALCGCTKRGAKYAGAGIATSTVGGVLMAATTNREPTTPTTIVGVTGMVLLYGGAVPFWYGMITGVHGFVTYERPPTLVAVEDPALRARVAAREHAWRLTKAAAAAARAEDCATAGRLALEVHAVDADFHATVFSRDVAIERCLAH